MDFLPRLREKEGIRILDLRGPLVLGDSESILRTAITALAEELAVNIILNLADVTAMDDAGLGTIVDCQSQLAHSGGNLKLLSPNPLYLTIPVVIKLYSALEIFNDEQDAVNSFFSGRETRHYDFLEWVREQEHRPDGGVANDFAGGGESCPRQVSKMRPQGSE
jgi:anti-sigma B factor antagonist